MRSNLLASTIIGVAIIVASFIISASLGRLEQTIDRKPFGGAPSPSFPSQVTVMGANGTPIRVEVENRHDGTNALVPLITKPK